MSFSECTLCTYISIPQSSLELTTHIIRSPPAVSSPRPPLLWKTLIFYRRVCVRRYSQTTWKEGLIDQYLDCVTGYLSTSSVKRLKNTPSEYASRSNSHKKPLTCLWGEKVSFAPPCPYLWSSARAVHMLFLYRCTAVYPSSFYPVTRLPIKRTAVTRTAHYPVTFVTSP